MSTLCSHPTLLYLTTYVERGSATFKANSPKKIPPSKITKSLFAQYEHEIQILWQKFNKPTIFTWQRHFYFRKSYLSSTTDKPVLPIQPPDVSHVTDVVQRRFGARKTVESKCRFFDSLFFLPIFLSRCWCCCCAIVKSVLLSRQKREERFPFCQKKKKKEKKVVFFQHYWSRNVHLHQLTAKKSEFKKKSKSEEKKNFLKIFWHSFTSNVWACLLFNWKEIKIILCSFTLSAQLSDFKFVFRQM